MGLSYVGVTGITSVVEAAKVAKAFKDNPIPGHLGMLGVLVSLKSLRGESTAPNKRYSLFSHVRGILGAARFCNEDILTMIHYNSRETNSLGVQIEEIFGRPPDSAGVYHSGLCTALQLNIPHPSIDQVQQIAEKYGDMRIVLQVSRSMIGNQSAAEIVQVLLPYKDIVQDILVDPSGGSGQELDVGLAAAVARELHITMPEIHVGFAGGFSPENVEERLGQLVTALGGNEAFSIDVESGVRDKEGQEYGNDTLNLEKVSTYIATASRVFTREPRHGAHVVLGTAPIHTP